MSVGPDDDVRAVLDGELALLQPAIRAEPERVRSLLHPSFREFGASGRVWDVDAIVTTLAEDPGERPSDVQNVQVHRLGDDALLVTYVATSRESSSLRSSVWIREGGHWLLFFHQGTISAASEPSSGR